MKKSKSITLPQRFVPQFWDESDGRCAMVKKIANRYAELHDDCGVDSYQKKLLCQRAVFVSIQLETMEVKAAQTGDFNAGVYGQLVNTFLGLLKSLGLERRAKTVECLSTYIKSRKTG
ncbi:MAG: hypothetical protein ISS76_19940 [Phycisphaerae bacterium]|nr:hypothetical protein [Phycisphaerae bacterium]